MFKEQNFGIISNRVLVEFDDVISMRAGASTALEEENVLFKIPNFEQDYCDL